MIGIDGPGAAGKSTLAVELAVALRASVVSADDFYLPSEQRGERIGDDYDWRRLQQQVLLPVVACQPARYQRYDWADDALAEWHDVATGRPVIVEGVYVLRRELRGHFTYRIWVDAPPDVRLRRGLARDGALAHPRWKEWMRREDAYMSAERPMEAADRCVAGAR